MNRSYLFVPGDSQRKIDRARASNADAVIIDLEDAVVPGRRDEARRLAAAAAGGQTWVRINPLDSADAEIDLEAVVPSAPAGIVLPKPESAADVIDLAARLDELEAANGLDAGCVRIIALCTERPQALFSLGGYSGASERLVGLSWGAEDLGVAVGATQTRGADGEWLPPYQIARVLCLFAAAAAGVAAIDTVYTDFRDADGLAHYAANARRDGFSGMLAIHPAQVDVINAAFTPTQQEVERAERIIALFDDNPDAGTLGMDGEMLDRPHLLAAERIVALSKSKK